MEKKYITVGQENLYYELFCKIRNPLSSIYNKPFGGLWCSPYIGQTGNVCSWLNYLQDNQTTRLWKQNNVASLINLKENTKIYTIDSLDKLKKTQNAYQFSGILEDDCDEIIDYEQISNEYDALLINPDMISREHSKLWSSDTLLIFDLDCIQSYQSLKLAGDTEENEECCFFVDDISEDKTIQPIGITYYRLFEEINSYFNTKVNSKMMKNISGRERIEKLNELKKECEKLVFEKRQLLDKVSSRLEGNQELLNNKIAESISNNIYTNAYRPKTYVKK